MSGRHSTPRRKVPMPESGWDSQDQAAREDGLTWAEWASQRLEAAAKEETGAAEEPPEVPSHWKFYPPELGGAHSLDWPLFVAELPGLGDLGIQDGGD